jgi:hypothetical protein
VLTYVVEEFDEPQARALFYTFLARNRLLGDEDAIDDSVWRVVYEVRCWRVPIWPQSSCNMVGRCIWVWD